MGQINSDKDFRNKLNQREIKPSENAWDRLDAMLTIAEEKKPKRNYGGLYIAASFIGFLLIGTVFFSQTQEMIDVRKDTVVFEQNPNQESSTNTSSNGAEENTPTIQAETIASTTSVKAKHRSGNQHPTASASQNIAIAEATKNPELITSNNIINQKTQQQTIPAKVDELLAAVAQTPKTGNTKSSVKVNAKNLLSEVDGEINLSFREKILRTAHRNYQEVAEVVSNRNTQQ